MRAWPRVRDRRLSAPFVAVSLGLAATAALGQAPPPAPCPPFPVTGGGLALLMVIAPDGTLSACDVDATTGAARIYDPRPGFLCLFLKADARPTVTAIEGPLSSRADLVIVDGQVFPDRAPGYPHLPLGDVIGTGPSGETYDVVVQTTVEGARFQTTLNVTAGGNRQVTFNGLQVDPLE